MTQRAASGGHAVECASSVCGGRHDLHCLPAQASHWLSMVSGLVPACQQGLCVFLQSNRTTWFCRAAAAPQIQIPTTHLAYVPPALWQQAVYRGMRSRSG